jgi:hypothetical protein
MSETTSMNEIIGKMESTTCFLRAKTNKIEEELITLLDEIEYNLYKDSVDREKYKSIGDSIAWIIKTYI